MVVDTFLVVEKRIDIMFGKHSKMLYLCRLKLKMK